MDRKTASHVDPLPAARGAGVERSAWFGWERVAQLGLSCFLLAGFAAQAVDPLFAANSVRGAMVSAPSEVDADFPFQGEFLGRIQLVNGIAVFGLQVVAEGDGGFSGRSYQGGLPGNGWDGSEPSVWKGRRADQLVVLENSAGRMELDSMGATWISNQGAELGRLDKVRRRSGTIGAQPPEDATVLFDGSNVESFQKASMTPDGLLLAGATTKASFGDMRLHLEFRTPYMPKARGQGRGNSGVYIQQRYEVQILDSFGLPPVHNGCGALYKQQEPMLNMSFPPHSWQTYDIDFRAPRWDACGNKICDARITVWHNGVRIHDNYYISAKTGAGEPEGPEARPLRLQDHGNPVQYRNVWLVSYPQPEFQASPCCDGSGMEGYPARRRPRGWLWLPRRRAW
jgi:hypothetical protein